MQLGHPHAHVALPPITCPARATDANGAELAGAMCEVEASKGRAATRNKQARVLFNFISSSSSGDSLALQADSAQHYLLSTADLYFVISQHIHNRRLPIL